MAEPWNVLKPQFWISKIIKVTIGYLKTTNLCPWHAKHCLHMTIRHKMRRPACLLFFNNCSANIHMFHILWRVHKNIIMNMFMHTQPNLDFVVFVTQNFGQYFSPHVSSNSNQIVFNRTMCAIQMVFSALQRPPHPTPRLLAFHRLKLCRLFYLKNLLESYWHKRFTGIL